jgi:hypothetical protein
LFTSRPTSLNSGKGKVSNPGICVKSQVKSQVAMAVLLSPLSASAVGLAIRRQRLLVRVDLRFKLL